MPLNLTSKLGQLNYYGKLNKKDTDLQVQRLANRIEKLKQEEIRANKKIKETSKRAEEFINTRNKHYEEKKVCLYLYSIFTFHYFGFYISIISHL